MLGNHEEPDWDIVPWPGLALLQSWLINLEIPSPNQFVLIRECMCIGLISRSSLVLNYCKSSWKIFQNFTWKHNYLFSLEDNEWPQNRIVKRWSTCLNLKYDVALSMNKFLMCIKFYFIFSAGGTAGAVATCPLEVVKTRLQSSLGNSLASAHHPAFRPSHNTVLAHAAGIHTSQGAVFPVMRTRTGSLRYCLA